MSFIYKRNRSGPKIDPWGTPHESCPSSEKDLFKLTLNFLCDIYDLKPKNDILRKSEEFHFIDKDFVINCVECLLKINEYRTSMETGFKASCNFSV